MREAFAHDATVTLAPGGDEDALGAAITVALCGHWEHEPPCPLAPHATIAERDGDEVRVRTLFATEPEREAEARERIEAALASGEQQGPSGVSTRWTPRSSDRSEVLESERDHAGRLIAS